MKGSWWFAAIVGFACVPEPEYEVLPPYRYCPGVEPYAAGTRTCRDHNQCSADEHCQAPPLKSSTMSVLQAIPGVPAPMCEQAPATCAVDADCESGRVCDQRQLGGDWRCPKPLVQGCFPACSSHAHCPRHTSELGTYAERCDPADGHCRVVPCDQEDGAECESGFVCDPVAEITREDGCAPVSCDAGYACPLYTECAALRVERWQPGLELDGLAVDPHRCVEQQCTGGRPCPAHGSNGRPVTWLCAPDAPRADRYGCAPPSCSDDRTLCLSIARCAPSDPNSDVFGCLPVACRQGLACSGGTRCLPDDPDADARGCAPSPPGCEFDYHCPCGSCILGRCADRPGLCVPD